MIRPAAPILLAILLVAASLKADESAWGVRELKQAAEKLQPLHKKLPAPKPGEWLYVHGETETGQSFDQYRRSRPIRPAGRRNTIVILPLGAFTAKQRKALALTAECVGLYYCLPVRVEKTQPLSIIPGSARRTHPEWGVKQILTTHVLDKLLRPNLPRDAAAYICFTSSDLWPGGKWNFVFGQASLRWRVGVQSIYRNGDADGGETAFREMLLRTFKTAVHETGHMFSLHHCIKDECCLNGSNSREESDRKPLWLCPDCVAKVCWATRADPVERFQKLARWCHRNGLREEAAFYVKSAARLGTTVSLKETPVLSVEPTREPVGE